MIFLYGAYGTGNLGDDAILKSALEIYGRTHTRVVSYGPPLLEDSPEYIDHFEFIAEPKAFLGKGDRLIFAGGGLFWAASHAEVMRECAEAARQVGCAVEVERIGAQGVHVAVDDARRLFSLSDRVSVRDHFSVNLLKQLEITDRAIYEPDFVLELEDKPERCLDPNKLTIGINHSAVPFFHDEQHRKKALHIYSEIARRSDDQCRFVYIPQTRHFNVLAQNDVIYGEYFWHASKGRIEAMPFPRTVEELLGRYATVDVVLAWRYHALIMATIMGASAAFLGQPGGHKYSSFARENKLPQINFDLLPVEIIASSLRLIARARKERGL